MNFIEELTWRGMMHDYTPGAEEELASGMATGYIGFDPTAPSLTIGNYVQLRILKFFQKSGHRPIFLLGGATGSIGDPSGKDQERTLRSYDELNRNLAFQQKQASKFLNFIDGPNKALLVNNHDFYRDMNVLDFLRDVGKSATINYMLSKESVKRRLETGLSFTEFSYQLLQAYDFMCLYQKYNCKFQMGGSDQWGNITSGTEFVRKNLNGKAYAITTPLLTKSDGSKFGKSEEGNIWLDPELTSPYQFYQFWLRADDADLPTFFRYFSDKGKDEIEILEQELAEEPRALKKLLAEELTRQVHSKKDLRAVEEVSATLFDKKLTHNQLMKMDSSSFELIRKEIPTFGVPQEILSRGISLDLLLTQPTNILNSKSDVRRAVQNNAISINKIKMNAHDIPISDRHLIHNKFIFVENGKKNKYLIQLADDPT